MKRPLEISGILNPVIDSNSHVVYFLRDIATAEILFVGSGPLNSIFTLNELNRNGSFERNRDYIFQLHSRHDNRVDALNAVGAWMRTQETMPTLNRHGAFGHKGDIRCNETGEVFRSQKAAAMAHGIDAGALGRHLARKPYHKSVKGRTYDFVRRTTA